MLVLGLYKDSTQAGQAVGELKGKGYGDEISVVSKHDGEVKSHGVDETVSDGVAGGAVTGAAIGGIAAVIAGLTSFIVPGIGLIVYGPLAAALTTAAAGAVTGGVVGALVDKGIPDNTASMYQDRISHGETLVAVDITDDKSNEVASILSTHGASDVNVQ